MGARRIAGITVEIGGDTTKLTTALKDVDKALSTTQSSLRDVNKLLKLDPGNTELLAQKHRLLGEAVSEAKEKLATLKTAAEQANQALANGEITQSQYDALQREIIETEQKLKDLERQAENSSVALQKIGQVGDKLQAVGDKVSGVGETLTKSVTAPVVGLGTAAVATAANFESSMSQVQATMGITKDSMSTVNGESVNTMDTLSALAKQMGSETAFSASECAEALNYLALAGYSTQEMCDTLPTVLNLAAAGGIDLASASDMVTDAMSALGMGTDEATTMVDQMAKTSSTTNTSVAQLGDAILTIGATAKSVKGGTAELNTALGILANNGIKGAEGGTHLRNVILSLQNPTDKAAACMEQLGVDVYDSEGNMRSLNDVLGDLNTSMDGMTAAEKSNIIATIFNKTDLAAVNALLANTGETWDDLQQSIIESSGAAQQMANTQLDNLQGQLTILKSALEGLAISIGEILFPVIKNIVSGIQGFVDWLNNLDEGTKQTIVTIGLIVAAVGPVLIVIGKVISAVGTILSVVSKIGPVIGAVKTAATGLFTVLAANPIALVVAAIAALIAIFVVLWNNCEGFREFWIGLWEAIKSAAIAVWEALSSFFQGAWEAIVNLAQTIWGGIGDFFSGLWEAISSTAQAVWNAISGFLSGLWSGIVSAAQSIWGGIIEFFSGLWQGISTTAQTVWNAISTFLSGLWTSIVNIAQTIWNGIVTFFSGLWEGIRATAEAVWNGISTFLSTLWTTISTAAQTIWNGIKEFFAGAWEAISSTAQAAWNGIKEFLSGIWEAIKGVFTTALETIQTVVTGAWEAIKNVVTTAMEALQTAISTAWEAIKTAITTALEAIKTAVTMAWEAIKTAVTTAMEAIKTAITTAWEAIKTAVLTVMEAVRTAITAAWEAIKTAVTTVVNAIKDTVTQVWNAIKDTVSGIMDRLKETVVNAWNALKEAVTNVVNGIKEAVTGVFNGLADGVKTAMTKVLDAVKSGFNFVKDHILGLGKQAVGWGRDLIMGIVNGIKGAIGAVKDAVGNVASTIKSFLHFSVPDEGPLTDYESWMPDFMAGLARGIEQSRGAVKAAIGSVADDLTLTPTITAATSGLETIRNGGMTQTESITAASGNSEMAARLDAMYEVVTKYLPRLANRQIVLDSGTLVGELSDGMNRTLGRAFL
ncbi:phage tail tape measure protein [Clostridiaceae bacterium]|nr:phage tail tape measure protein [Clostridiaceae bacterium]